MKIAAGIVLYHPNEERFKKEMEIVLQQFDKVFIFDNLGDHQDLTDDDRIVYLTENENKGIAYGLNAIMRCAQIEGYDWVMTLDQDTIVPTNICSVFMKYLTLNNVAILCPQVIDRRRLYLKPQNTENEIIDLDFCITSASCTNVKIWEELGGYDDWLFIDFVDNDYCKRVKANGYRIIQILNVVIDQEFGVIELKTAGKVKFYLWLSKVLNNKNIAKLTYKKTVNPLRVYYIHRNLLYLNKKYKNYGGIGYENFYCSSFIGFLFYFTLPSIVRGQKKLLILKSIIRGFREGIKSAPEPFSI